MARRSTRLAGFARRTPFAWALAMCTTLSLVACGGGGGDDPADPAVAPSGNSSASSLLPLRTNVVNAEGVFQSQSLLLIDPATGQAVWQKGVGTGSTQVAVRAFSVSADGLTVTQGPYAAWFYTDQGKLHAVDLGSAPPQARQVSSEAAVCDVLRAEPINTSASTSWVLLGTAGADGQCETESDNVHKLVRSDAGASTAALAWAGGRLEPVHVHRDAAGTLTQLLAHDTATQRLLAVSATDGSASLVTGGQLAAGTSVAWIGRGAGRRDQGFLVVKSAGVGELRTLSWAGDTGVPTLGASSLLGVTSLSPAFAQTDDARGFYFVDNGSVYMIAKGATTVSTLDTLSNLQLTSGDDTYVMAPPFFAGGAMTNSALVIPALSQTGAVVYVIDKAPASTERRRTLALPVDAETPFVVEAHQGDQVVVSRAADVGGPVRELWRADVSVAGSIIPVSKVSAAAYVIASPAGDTAALGGEAEQAATVWCDASVACTAARVQSLQLATGANLALAGTGAAGFEWVDHLAGANAGSRSGVSVSGQNALGLWTSDSAWLLDASQAGSLKQVVLP
jgi:hypothetical protein